MVCGKLFHTGAPVVLWVDPGGYDAYRTEKRFGPATRASAGRTYGIRMGPLTDAEVERVRTEGWTFDFLREKVDQFVLHYDVAGVSRTCFRVLHDERGLSVHFMLDIDGTIYQTLDLKEEAAHATSSNGRSIGIEIANMGAYAPRAPNPFATWYAKDADGRTRITLPEKVGDGGVRTKTFVGRPARNDLVQGFAQGDLLQQYDYTPQQYESLTKLTATLCTVFPKIQCDYPRLKPAVGTPTTRRAASGSDPANQPDALARSAEQGALIPHALSGKQLDEYQGVLGHYHIQTDKIDPGPAFQWERVINGARRLMTREALAANERHRDQPARFIPSEPTTRPR